MKNKIFAALALLLLFSSTIASAQVTGSASTGVSAVAPMPVGNNQIAQLSNLTVQSVSGTTITAATNIGATCNRYNNGIRSIACPMIADRIYQINVSSQTILLQRDRSNGSMSQFAAGDSINAYGFLDGNIMTALIVRDLSKPSWNRYLQISGATVLSAPASANAPTTLSIQDTMGNTYTINTAADTYVLYSTRRNAPLSTFVAGDRVNVYGWLHDGSSLDAVIIRDMSKDGSVIYPTPTVTPNPLPDLSLSITPENQLQAVAGAYSSVGFKISGGYSSSAYTITTDGSDIVPGMSFTRTPCAPGNFCSQMINNSEIFLAGTPTQTGTYTVNIQAQDNPPLPPCAVSVNGGPVCMIRLAPHTGSASFTFTVIGQNHFTN